MYTKIDVYNYKIHNYHKYDIPTSFGNIYQNIDSDINKKISVLDTDNIMDPNVDNSMILSVDPLYSMKSKNKYYLKYKEDAAKSQRKELRQNDKDLYENLLEKVNKNMEEKLGLYNPPIKDATLIRLYTDITDTDGYIRKLEITNRHKIVIFGDHHGSYHTFFRNMLRLHIFGVLNLNTYTINVNYKIIFLGDIIDRGQHSLEILEILFRFILNDKTNNRIILGRGNHETISVSTNYGFKKEVDAAYKDITKSEHIFTNIMNFFMKCPTAVIIKNIDSNHNFWLCHGFIPLYPGFNTIIKDFISSSNNIYLPPLDIHSMMMQIRWNDPGNILNNDFSRRDRDKVMGIFEVGLNYTKKFLEEAGIKFIIRGHNDYYANAIILCNKMFRMSHNQTEKIVPFFELGAQQIGSKELLSERPIGLNQYNNGSVSNIIVKNDNWNMDIDKSIGSSILSLYPVLTISTNTDFEKPLTCDSFIVLSTLFSRAKQPNREVENFPGTLDNSSDLSADTSTFSINGNNKTIEDYLNKKFSYIDIVTKKEKYYSSENQKHIQTMIANNINDFTVVETIGAKKYQHKIIISSTKPDNGIKYNSLLYTDEKQSDVTFVLTEAVIVNTDPYKSELGVIDSVINKEYVNLRLVNMGNKIIIINIKNLMKYPIIKTGDTVCVYGSKSLPDGLKGKVISEVSISHLSVQFDDGTRYDAAKYRLKKC